MATLTDESLAGDAAENADIEWLRLLVGDWQLIADLAFADLVLWVRDETGEFVASRQCRPSTGSTIHETDIVGSRPTKSQRDRLERASNELRIQRDREPQWYGGIAVREEAIPVVRGGRCIGVITRQTNLATARTPGRLEIHYIEGADEIIRMISRGEFPHPAAPAMSRRGAPRVGDGFIRLDADGAVLFASPNAISCLHRLGVTGELTRQSFSRVITEQMDADSVPDETLPLVLTGRAPWRTDIEANRAVLSLRAVPLTVSGRRVGAVVLCRDVTELRRREREIMTKDATIREIHHRVKNNLQTVAALLRLQARRTEIPEARTALAEAMRRVATIAVVHETLSQTFDETVSFDDVVDRSLRLAADVASPEAQVRTVREGRFGTLQAEVATPLALVLTELVTNAVEHGFPGKTSGEVRIACKRTEGNLTVTISDNGVGLRRPTDAQAGNGEEADVDDLVGLDDVWQEGINGLGSQIVRTLVTGELQGSIEWRSPEGGGTEVILQAPLQDLSNSGAKR
ncbi:MAG TPA: histidine kinase N-terminal domain-containing protein [Actinomycetales bacterium]|nr:histidine kinase N-terminal domain-containing protein [Actinomycetales bacterium]